MTFIAILKATTDSSPQILKIKFKVARMFKLSTRYEVYSIKKIASVTQYAFVIMLKRFIRLCTYHFVASAL